MGRIDDDIRNGTYSRVYLLYGDEDYLKQFYKNRLKAALIREDDTINLNEWKGKDISLPELTEQAMTLPFFAEHRLIILEDTGLFKKGGTEVADLIEKLPEETVMLFVEQEVDARGKLFKTVRSIGCPMELKRLSEPELQRWILRYLGKAGRQIQRSAMKELVERIGNDMTLIHHELDKLISYTHGRTAVMLEDVQAVTCVSAENRVFDIVMAAASRRQESALELYHDLLSNKESPLKILVTLSREYDRIWQTKQLREQGLDGNTIARRTGMQSYQVRRALQEGAGYTLDELRRILEECVLADESIKRGKMGDALAVELVITHASAPG